MDRPEDVPEWAWDQAVEITSKTMASGSPLFTERLARAVMECVADERSGDLADPEALSSKITEDRPKDIPLWAWDEALETFDDWRGPGPVKLVSAGSVARAILKTREEAFEEAAKIADTLEIWAKFEGDFEANQVAAAIRQHSQKGER